jgi:hypothetical protein
MSDAIAPLSYAEFDRVDIRVGASSTSATSQRHESRLTNYGSISGPGIGDQDVVGAGDKHYSKPDLLNGSSSRS